MSFRRDLRVRMTFSALESIFSDLFRVRSAWNLNLCMAPTSQSTKIIQMRVLVTYVLASLVESHYVGTDAESRRLTKVVTLFARLGV